MSDRFGRRSVYLSSVLGAGLSGALSALSPSFPVWAAARAAAGAFAVGTNLASNVYRTEVRKYLRVFCVLREGGGER